MAFEDHRAHPRANLRWTVSVQLSGAVTEGVTKDISEGGAYVCCANPLGPNEVLDMVINAPNKPLNVKAEVVRSSMSGLDDEITPRGMGVRFLNIDSEDRRIIAEAVVEHLSENTESEELQASMFDTLEID
jgi:c-di-GMP-binding flagellar brake protein YcgR